MRKSALHGASNTMLTDNTTELRKIAEHKRSISSCGICQVMWSNLASFKKKAIIAKRSSIYGAIWDVMQVVFSVLACALYIGETYSSTYEASIVYNIIELIITQFFLIDFLFNWFVATSTRQYLLSVMTCVDVVTIVPVYVSLILGDEGAPNLSLLRFVRILRLIRILRTFKLLGGMSGIKRQMITLSLTLLSLTFMAAGVVQVVENDVKQLSYDCKYIGLHTNYEPSCEKGYATYDDKDCDCRDHSCRAAYVSSDHRGEPSYIRCNELPYFDCFYFIIVTMATVGYGDIAPSTSISKMVIILFIVTSLIVIPMQVNKLTLLLSMSSAYRRSFAPQSHENHVIVCGHVNDSSKLERIFKEFFHPDRHIPSTPEFHLVILCPMEPSEEVRSLLVSPLFDGRVSYIIGSALSMEDLQRVRADVASAMFFVCNIEVQSQEAFFDDAATVLRTLSVSNFNSNLECLVQVLRPEDRDILKDSDVDVIICLDEFKTTMQARNAICPGLSTFVENMFHSFGAPVYPPREDSTYWLDEYIHGARMELYYVPLENLLLEALNFEWNLLVEGIFVEYGRVMIGVCNIETHSVVYNPGAAEMKKFDSPADFFQHYDVGIILAHEQSEANAIASGIADQGSIDRMTFRMLEVEVEFAIRRMPDDESEANPSLGLASLGKYSLNTQRRKVEKSFKEILTYTKLAPKSGGDVVGDGELDGSVITEKASSASVVYAQSRRRSSAAHYLPQVKKLKSPVTGGSMFGAAEDKPTVGIPLGLGKPSCQIANASNISDHIIVFGCVDYIHLFVTELRRPLIRGDSYRPLVIVSEYQPNKWAAIKSRFNDVYFLQEILTTSQGFNASNVRDAFAVVLLASRDSVTMVEEENLDAETLFAYLKLERYIPRYVYFTVELTCSNNMAVLNSTIMRRTRGMKVNQKSLQKKKSSDLAYNKKTPVVVGSVDNQVMEQMQIKGTFSSQKKVVASKQITHTQSTKNLLRSNPGRRVSSLKTRDFNAVSEEQKMLLKTNRSFWDVLGSHHVLPVFAAGMSYVPSVFDTLLVQVSSQSVFVMI
jgi:hypothetical protein